MKKKFMLVPILALSATALVSCGGKKKDANVMFYVPDDTSALAVAKLMDNGFEYDGNKLEFKVVSSSSIGDALGNKKCDLALCPTVVAATSYKEGNDIKLVTNNIFGNLYLVSTGASNNLSDLVGKVVYTTTGTTLKLLQYELVKNDILYQTGNEAASGKVTICTKQSPSEIITTLLSGARDNNEAIAVLGEPFVTNASQKLSSQGYNLNVVADMQDVYSQIVGSDNKKYPQISIVSHNDFADEHEEFISKLYEALSSNAVYAASNYEDLNSILSKYNLSIAGTTFSAETIERCNLGLEKACNYKEYNNTYLKNLTNLTIDDEFYYEF